MCLEILLFHYRFNPTNLQAHDDIGDDDDDDGENDDVHSNNDNEDDDNDAKDATDSDGRKYGTRKRTFVHTKSIHYRCPYIFAGEVMIKKKDKKTTTINKK